VGENRKHKTGGLQSLPQLLTVTVLVHLELLRIVNVQHIGHFLFLCLKSRMNGFIFISFSFRVWPVAKTLLEMALSSVLVNSVRNTIAWMFGK